MMCHQFNTAAFVNRSDLDRAASWCSGLECGLALNRMATLIPNFIAGRAKRPAFGNLPVTQSCGTKINRCTMEVMIEALGMLLCIAIAVTMGAP